MNRLEFGLQPPPGVTVAWGARALYHTRGGRATFEILIDRQSWIGDADARKPLKDWCNGYGLRQLEDIVQIEMIPSNNPSEISYQGEGFTIKASTRASCGYLYIVAYPTPKCRRHDPIQAAFRWFKCHNCPATRVRGERWTYPEAAKT